ncbi:MAG: hypothetical protein NTW19_05990 [Planctomycetota bacterium]|nr:hypothetical protein [Planctomycetota bacterium]
MEQFLLTALCNLQEGKSLLSAAEQLQKIPIIHLHGTLGTHQYLNINTYRSYDGMLNRHTVDECVQQLKVIHEEADARMVDEARHRLLSADQILCLGFGFHELNIRRLGLDNPIAKSLTSNRFGITNNECKQIQRKVKWSLNYSPTECDSLRFLREHVSFA